MISYIKGLFDVLKGMGLIFQSGVRRYVIVPLIINITLFAGAIALLSKQMETWLDRLLPGWLSWLEWLILPLFYATISLAVFYTFTIVANIIAAPFNSLLSASIEAKLSGKKPQDITQDKFWKIAIRTIGSELGKLLYFIKWLIPVVIITFIPVVNVIAPFLWFLYAAWSFSLEYTDYPLANRGMLFKEIKAYNGNNRMRSLGLGTAVFILTSIPFVNFIAMPVAVAGATRLTVQQGVE
jgi:CysZ protein